MSAECLYCKRVRCFDPNQAKLPCISVGGSWKNHRIWSISRSEMCFVFLPLQFISGYSHQMVSAWVALVENGILHSDIYVVCANISNSELAIWALSYILLPLISVLYFQEGIGPSPPQESNVILSCCERESPMQRSKSGCEAECKE